MPRSKSKRTLSKKAKKQRKSLRKTCVEKVASGRVGVKFNPKSGKWSVGGRPCPGIKRIASQVRAFVKKSKRKNKKKKTKRKGTKRKGTKGTKRKGTKKPKRKGTKKPKRKGGKKKRGHL
jgi:hypothetical protein